MILMSVVIMITLMMQIMLIWEEGISSISSLACLDVGRDYDYDNDPDDADADNVNDIDADADNVDHSDADADNVKDADDN